MCDYQSILQNSTPKLGGEHVGSRRTGIDETRHVDQDQGQKSNRKNTKNLTDLGPNPGPHDIQNNIGAETDRNQEGDLN